MGRLPTRTWQMHTGRTAGGAGAGRDGLRGGVQKPVCVFKSPGGTAPSPRARHRTQTQPRSAPDHGMEWRCRPQIIPVGHHQKAGMMPMAACSMAWIPPMKCMRSADSSILSRISSGILDLQSPGCQRSLAADPGAPCRWIGPVATRFAVIPGHLLGDTQPGRTPSGWLSQFCCPESQ